MTVQTYSKKASGDMRISDHFKIREFASKDGADQVLIDDQLVKLLEFIRGYFGQPVIITSAYRSPEHNKQVGGRPTSQHVNGTAADIVVQGVDALRVAQAAEYFLGNSGGIGHYPISRFTHVDVRAKASRWYEYKRSQITVRNAFPIVDVVEEMEKRKVETEKVEIKKIAVIIDGKEQQLDGVFVSGMNYVSIRQLAKLLDCEVSNKGSIPVLETKQKMSCGDVCGSWLLDNLL